MGIKSKVQFWYMQIAEKRETETRLTAERQDRLTISDKLSGALKVCIYPDCPHVTLLINHIYRLRNRQKATPKATESESRNWNVGYPTIEGG
jgi:hypothetical protein